jgi:hypothetical protein
MKNYALFCFCCWWTLFGGFKIKVGELASFNIHIPWDVISLFERTEDSYEFHLPNLENWVRWSYQEYYRNLLELPAPLTTSWSVYGRKLCWCEMCVRELWIPQETLLIKILKYHWSEKKKVTGYILERFQLNFIVHGKFCLINFQWKKPKLCCMLHQLTSHVFACKNSLHY